MSILPLWNKNSFGKKIFGVENTWYRKSLIFFTIVDAFTWDAATKLTVQAKLYVKLYFNIRMKCQAKYNRQIHICTYFKIVPGYLKNDFYEACLEAVLSVGG